MRSERQERQFYPAPRPMTSNRVRDGWLLAPWGRGVWCSVSLNALKTGAPNGLTLLRWLVPHTRARVCVHEEKGCKYRKSVSKSVTHSKQTTIYLRFNLRSAYGRVEARSVGGGCVG